MANAYSTAINYGSPIPVGNTIKYLGAIQHGMQQKFDINLAKIDELISKVATVPLARDKDKRYLGDKLQGLLSVVDANSKIDLTDNVVARQISAYVTTAIDDNVKEQLANSQKIANYQQTAAQRKKDKPELYSDANYAYGLDKSGYANYMSEKDDSLGSMEYVDYYDVDKNLNKELEAFAKERGFEKVLSSGPDGNEYVYKTVKGKTIDPEEVSNFFDNKIASDPKLRQQFMINSHYNHRGVSDTDLIKAYTEQSGPILKDYDTKISDIDEKLRNVSADDKSTADLLHRKKSEMQQQKDSFSSQLDPKNFNRDSFLYSQYTDGMKKSYMKTYAYSAVTDVKYDEFLSKLNKEDSTDSTSTGAEGAGLAAGTRFKVDESAKGLVKEEANYTQQFKAERQTAWTNMQGVIKAKLIEEGKQPTVANMTSYYTGLKEATKNGVNLNAEKGYDTEVLNAFNKVVDANKTSFQLTKVAKESYGKSTDSILTGLFGGKAKDLSIEGLATTAPYTAELLKNYKSAEQLTNKQKALAKYELAKNLKQYVLEDDRERANMDFYINSIKRENNISDKDLARYTKIKPGQQDFGFFEGTWEAAKLAGSRFFDAPGNIVATLATPFRRSESNAKGQEEYNKKQLEYSKRSENLDRNLYRGLSKMFTSDSDLSDIQSGDIKLGKYQGVGDLIKDTSTSVSARFDEILQKSAKKEIGTYAIVLNPAIKKDKAYTDVINSAIINAITMDEKGVQNAGPPVKDTPIKIANISGGVAQVTYTQEIDVANASGKGTKKGESQVTVSIPLENLPKGLVGGLKTQVSDWTYSGKNGSSMKQIISFSPPKDLDSKYDFTQTYLKNYGSALSQADIAGLQTSGMQGVVTKEEYRNAAEKALPAEYAKEFDEKYLKSDYKIEWERPEGARSGFVGHLMQNGKRIDTLAAPSLDYNPHMYSLASIKAINGYIESKISDYKLKAFKLSH